MARVVSIHRVSERDGPAVALEAAVFIQGLGLEGDWRSRRGRARQVTLVEADALRATAAVLGMANVPPGASRRQVMVEGIALNETVGKQLRIGAMLVSVETLCEPCANMEVKIGPGAQQALVGRGGVCARVLEGGVVRPGDPVEEVE